MGRWSEWHGGECWGPRLMTDALPLLFLFLPEGLTVTGLAGTALALLSVGVQALGAFAYDYRWERLYQREGNPTAALWEVARSPIFFYVQRGRPAPRPSRASRGQGHRARASPAALRARRARGSIFARRPAARRRARSARSATSCSSAGPGSRATVCGCAAVWTRVFFRVREGARPRRLEVRVEGRGRGNLYVGERAFSSDATKWTAYPMNGAFRVRHPYEFKPRAAPTFACPWARTAAKPTSSAVSLVSPSEPTDVIRLGAPDL